MTKSDNPRYDGLTDRQVLEEIADLLHQILSATTENHLDFELPLAVRGVKPIIRND